MQGNAQRLGKNLHRYLGDPIDLAAVQRELSASARQHGWRSDTLLAAPGVELPVYHRPSNLQLAAPARRIYLSAGIHGDEPAGPLAVRELLRANFWPADADLWLCPCLNPTGFPLNQRESSTGLDLNRDYRAPRSAEVRAHVAWLDQQPHFDLTLCLHEDWEAHGFYVYELNPDQQPSLAESMIAAVREVCPIDPSPLIDGREASEGIIRPHLDPALRPEWPEAFYLIQRKTRLSYTLESPSDFPLPVRVAALVAGVRAALGSFPLR